MELREKLTILREERNLSQGELAGKVGVSRQTVSKWERGVIAPSTVNLIALARVYGVPLDELVNGEPHSEESPATIAAVAETPDHASTPHQFGLPKLAAAIVTVVCVLLMTAASIITICSTIFKEPEAKKDEIISMDDMRQEDIDYTELTLFDGKCEVFEP